jgi:hypothetical protein
MIVKVFQSWIRCDRRDALGGTAGLPQMAADLATPRKLTDPTPRASVSARGARPNCLPSNPAELFGNFQTIATTRESARSHPETPTEDTLRSAANCPSPTRALNCRHYSSRDTLSVSFTLGGMC